MKNNHRQFFVGFMAYVFTATLIASGIYEGLTGVTPVNPEAFRGSLFCGMLVCLIVWVIGKE